MQKVWSRSAVQLTCLTLVILHHGANHRKNKFKKIQENGKKVYGDKALKRTQMQTIVNKATEGKPVAVDQRHLISPWSGDCRPETVKKLAQARGLLTKMVHATLHKDLKLAKKLARWVPRLLDEMIKKARWARPLLQ